MRLPWNLILINQNNPLPENFTVETKKVQGDYMLDKRIANCAIQMFACAKMDGIDLKVISAYRSVDYQKGLFEKSTKAIMDKQGLSFKKAFQEVAKSLAIPGQSEHNAGLALDIMTAQDSDVDESFKDTDEFKWLMKNAWKFGFILRYPENKTSITGIVYEPWHWRYVGCYDAKKINMSGLSLEEYIDVKKRCCRY